MTTPEPPTRRTLGRRSLLGLLTAAPTAIGGVWALNTANATGSGATPAHGTPTPPRLRPGGEFDTYLSQLAEQDKFSGTVLVARDGRPVLSRSFGFADKKNGVPNRADTIYCLASVTKLFTAIAIAQLVQNGTLTLVDPIGKHLSGFASEVADKVTIHHLLTHTSGLGDFVRDEGYAEVVFTWTTPEQIMDGTLDFIRMEPLAFTPGAATLHSNSGYHVLGSIIEKVAGTSYYDYVREHIFRPAGMTDSDFVTLPAWRSGRRFAHPYPTGDSGTRSDGLDQDDLFAYIGNPAGNAFATAADLVRFVRALLGDTLLDAPYREVFLSPKLPGPPMPARPDLLAQVPFDTYGPGAFLVNGRWSIGAAGAMNGVSTSLQWFPGTGWVAVKLSNYDVQTTAPVDQQLRKILTS